MKKIPFILQHDESDCGVACLASLLLYYGKYVSLRNIREHCGTDKDGTSGYGIVKGGEQPSVVIYAVDNKPEKLDGYVEHFVNSNGFGTYYNSWNDSIGHVSDIDLAFQGLGEKRTLTFYSGE